MPTLDSPPSALSAPITSIQPGGGWCMSAELAWGRLRRAWLRTFRPGYVRRMAGLRQGACPDCPHDIVDPRDLKYYRNVCGYWFRPEDDPFRWRDRIGLARVGLCEIVFVTLFAAVLLGGLCAGYWAGYPYWIILPVAAVIVVLWLQLVLFFRDPERLISGDATVLVSPADGTITDIGEVDEPTFAGGRAFRVGIFLSVFNVHVNRAPRASRVVRLQYFPGKFLDARNPEAARQNEQLWIDLEDAATGQPVRVKQISGAIARRIVCWLKPGDELKTGERIGMIKFGSRTEVYLPMNVPVTAAVRVGQKVKGGETVLLQFADRGS